MRRTLLSLLYCVTLSGLAVGQATTTTAPATAPAAKVGVLEFRIAPYAPGTQEGAMASAERDRYVEMLSAEGPEPARRRNEPYLWFPLRDAREKTGNLIVADYAGRSYVLVSNQPGEVMLQGTGAEAWGLKDVFRDTDESARPAVGFTFDSRGATRFGDLTGHHIGQLLAVLVDDEVYSCPHIRSVVSSRGVIAGNFTPQEVRELVRTLRAGSVTRRPADQAPATIRLATATRAATSPAQHHALSFAGKVVDAQGQPVGQATVGLYTLDMGESVVTPRAHVVATATTPKEGTFALKYDVPPSPAILTLVAMKEGMALDWDYITPGRERPEEFVLTLTKGGGQLTGVVVDESGAPIAGAQVGALLMIGRDVPEKFIYPSSDIPPLTCRTDAAGQFTLRDLPSQAHVGFCVTAPGKATALTVSDEPPFMPYSLESKDIKIAMEPAATLKGQAVDSATGQGVAGIKVRAMPRARGPRRGMAGGVATSDAQGRFAFAGLPAGDYDLAVIPDKETIWVSQWTAAKAVVGEQAQEVKVELTKGTRLEVTVVQRDGTPLADALVHANPANRTPASGSTTNDQGVAALNLGPGEYRLYVNKTGYRPVEEPPPVTVVQDQPQTLRIEMGVVPKFHGVVRDGSGNPVEAATVRLLPYGQETKTGPDGTFTILGHLFPEQGRLEPKLLVRHEERNLAALADIPEEGKLAEVVLKPAVTLACTVTDPSDKPLPQAKVTPYLTLASFGTSLTRDSAVTDANGRCQVSAVPAGARVNVSVEAEGYGSGSQSVTIEEDKTGVEALPAFVLQEARESLSGVVVDADDKPVPGAQVFASGPGQAHRRVLAGDDGKFTIDKLVAGPVDLFANSNPGAAASQSGSANAQTGDTDVRVVLGQHARGGPPPQPKPVSLLGKPLPDLAEVGLTDAAQTTAGKGVLVCFFDLDQKPSRRLVLALATKSAELEAKGIVLVLVHAATVERDRLDAWMTEQRISFPVGMVSAKGDKARAARAKWGAAALPWMILTDSQHKVLLEGSSLSDLEARLAAPTTASAPATQAAE